MPAFLRPSTAQAISSGDRRVRCLALLSALLTLNFLVLPAPSRAQSVNLQLQTLGGSAPLGLQGTVNLPNQLLANGAAVPLPLNGLVTLNLALPSGYALTGLSCPGGVGATVKGTTVTLTPPPLQQPVGTLGTCIFTTLNALGTTVATAVPFIARRNDFLLSVELGLDQQLDRFSSPGDGDDDFPETSALTSPTSFAQSGSGFAEGTTRMGLLGQGEDNAPAMFATSLQQTQRNNAAIDRQQPAMLGATSRAPTPAPQREFNLWAEGYWAWFDQDRGPIESDGHAGVLYAGADYMISPRLLLGALIQYDDLEQKFDGSAARISDTGWMAGPYAVVKLSESVFFQGRAAWGQSDNKIYLTDSISDRFDTDRWLVKGRLLANLRSGQWLLRPSASIAYIEEDQGAYISTTGVGIASNTVSLGQAKLGPEISYKYAAGGGLTVIPSLTLEGVWNFSEEHGATIVDDLVSGSGNDVRGRVEAGVTIVSRDSFSIGANATYDGIGDSGYQAMGGRARVKVPLN